VKDDASVEGNGDGNGQVPPGQTEEEDGTIVNPGGHMPPGLNRGEKEEKPDNPGTEDSADKKANQAGKGTHKYGYDSLNRMTSSNIAGTTTTYTYDTLGNLVLEKSKNDVVDYQYNELNQLTKKKEGSESYSYTYDKWGNRTAEAGKKASRSYLYDETNRMVEGTNWKGDKSAYTYNGLGLRVNNTHTTHAGKVYARDYVIDYTSFENDDLMVFAEGNGQLEYEQKHVYAGSERIEQFTDKGNWERTLYVHEDVMGNTRYYTKANGQSFAELTYDAWGMPESPNKLLNNDHGNYVFATFTGHIYDTTLDIYFAEARFYDANNRTWLAMDPIKDGGNWYQYCYGDPIKYFDPNGLKVFVVGYELAEAMGVRIGAGTQLVFDGNGNVGILDYTFTGGGFPSVGIGGLSIGFYHAEEIWDLDGMGGSVGGGGNFFILGAPVSISADYIVGLARDGSMVWGITFSVSGEAAFPIEMHGEWMVSKVYKLFNIPEEIENVKKLYRAAKSIFQALSHC
jgi:RHS repeat-associated protein